MASYAALVSLLNTINQIMDHPQVSTFFDTKNIQPLLEKVGLLLDFIETNNYGAGSKEADELEREIASAAYAAENVLDLHIMDQIHAESSEACLRCPLELQQKTQAMDGVLRKANEFKGNQGSEEEKREQPPPVMEIGETSMVGLDAELIHLLHELTGEPQSSLRTISIVGMGGMGKTTLAKNIFENKLIKEHFDIRAWATISQKHSAQGTLSQLLQGLEKSNNESVDELGLQLHKNLCGRRYLIILDDVWSVKALDEVKRLFPNDKNGSRIVLTTRLSNVANDSGSAPFMMRFLDEDSSWKLFCEKVFKNEACPEELWEMGKLIVKSCKGLALSIVVMGGLLSKSPMTVEYWNGVVENMKSISEKEGSLDVLTLSYTHLPLHLKPCFLYMGTFAEDSEIIVSNVVRLWIAEGFIKPNGIQVLEEIGEGYLKDMIDRNLILVHRQRKNGKIRSCGIHDLLRDLCINLCERQELIHDTDYCILGTECRLIREYIIREEDEIPQARSIRVRYLLGKLMNQGLLRVLEAEMERESAAELHENVNLRYFASNSHYGVWELPTSISSLWNLQTLIIHDHFPHPDDLVVAPAEIWKMRQLRHLECPNIYLPPSNGEDQLENLQTLKRAANLRLSEVSDSIPNVEKLSLLYDYHSSRAFHGFFDKMQRDDYFRHHDLFYLGYFKKLKSLELVSSPFYQILGFELTFPSSLNKLSLKHCMLEWDDLGKIGSLPQLEVLILGDDTISEREQWSPIDGQFLRLKFLKIEDCRFKYLDANHSHFPVLEKLVLSNMPYLTEISLEVGDIPTLELIRVDRCNVSAAISAVKIKEDQLDNGSDTIQIQVSTYRTDRVIFIQEMKSNGFSISNIQLETI